MTGNLEVTRWNQGKLMENAVKTVNKIPSSGATGQEHLKNQLPK